MFSAVALFALKSRDSLPAVFGLHSIRILLQVLASISPQHLLTCADKSSRTLKSICRVERNNVWRSAEQSMTVTQDQDGGHICVKVSPRFEPDLWMSYCICLKKRMFSRIPGSFAITTTTFFFLLLTTFQSQMTRLFVHRVFPQIHFARSSWLHSFEKRKNAVKGSRWMMVLIMEFPTTLKSVW